MSLATKMLSSPALPGNVDIRLCIKSTQELGFTIFLKAWAAKRLSMIFPNENWSDWHREALIGYGFWACGKRDLPDEEFRVRTSNGSPSFGKFSATSRKKTSAVPALQ